jgi:hypothetical protein
MLFEAAFATLLLQLSSQEYFCEEYFKQHFPWISKGVSDLEICMDYFALPGRNSKNLNFHSHLS